MIRVVFMGTPRFAIPTLQAIWNNEGTDLVGVITQPDRRAGRGQKIQPPPVKTIAVEHGIPIIQPQRIGDDPAVRQFLEDFRPDVAVIVAFGQLLPPRVFDFPKYGTLNLHASLLPRYRGAAPIIHALLKGDQLTGVSIMRIEQRLDSGPILGIEELPVSSEVTAGEVEETLARVGADLLLRVLRPYVFGQLVPEPQDEALATYAPAIRKADTAVDWTCPAPRIHNLVRAFNPKPGARTTLRGGLVKLWKTRMVQEILPDVLQLPGSSTRSGTEGIRVICGDQQMIEFIQVQPENRRRMSASQFANGVRLQEGEVFG